VGAPFAEAFDTRLVEDTTESWEFWFGMLEGYADREGHARPTQRYCENGYRLGYWISNQRANHVRCKLEPERVRRLQALPGWTWDKPETAWDDGCRSLLTFVVREGHARVSANHEEHGYPLGVWVSRQRRARGTGYLGAERARRLAALPGWTWGSALSGRP